MKSTFSVITAVRNGLPDLKKTYLSLLQQTCQDFEWIVIDAASSDGTASWLASLSSLKYRVHWVSEPDKGISDAWNKGVSLASGDQVLILNAGDTYDINLLEIFSGEINPNQITCCHSRMLTEDGRFISVFLANPSKLWRGMHVPHNWSSVPRAFYTKQGGYRHMPHSMDFDWFHRYFCQYGVSGFRVIDAVLGDYRLGGHSDIHFRDGFLANEEIMKVNGTNRWIAAAIRRIYTMRHLMMKNKKL
jgi:glycosyltransferase involved in cell wall biosynthesis